MAPRKSSIPGSSRESQANSIFVVTNAAFDTKGTGTVSIVDSTALNFTGRRPFTVECRASVNAYPPASWSWAGLVTKMKFNVSNEFVLCITPDGKPFVSRGVRAQATNSIPTNTWTHLAGVYDGTNTLLYVDGALAATAVSTTTNGAAPVPITIGAAISNSVPFWTANAILDEARVWNIALPGETIADWKDQNISASHPNYTNLVAYAPLDGATNTIAVSGGSFVTLGGKNIFPFRVDLLANGYLKHRWTESPYQTTLTSTTPTRWNLMTYTVDGYGNSRYSTIHGVDSLFPLDSDNDGIPDSFDAFPFDPTRWLAPEPDPSDVTPITITITQP